MARELSVGDKTLLTWLVATWRRHYGGRVALLLQGRDGEDGNVVGKS